MDMRIFDVISIVAGLALIIAPRWAYNFGRQEHKEMPKSWPIVSRILGVLFTGIGLMFLFVWK